MFQPTNPSYVRSAVEATLDRHMGETEAERVLRQAQPYRERRVSRGTRGLFLRLGRVLVSVGRQIESGNTPAVVLPQR